MAQAIPAALKDLQIAPFAKRAAQLERFKPVITYWLRFYIVQRIIASGLHSADSECTAFTTNLMEKLEQAKADNPSEDALLDDTVASVYCEQFAMQVFAKGEKEMSENRANGATADTLLAASTFFDLMSIWKKDSDPEIVSKTKFAKYHVVRILKALKANEDPNLTNPVLEQPDLLSSLHPDTQDPEFRKINHDASMQSSHNPYQPYVESAPNTAVQPSSTFSTPQPSPLPLDLPSAAPDYTQSSHHDVSPLSEPATSRHGSAVSAGGGYFPTTNPVPPTFTAEPAVSGVSTSVFVDDTTMASEAPSSPQIAEVASVSDATNFYQDVAPPPPTAPTSYQEAPQNPAQYLRQSPVFDQQQQQHHHAISSSQPSSRQQYASLTHQNPYAQHAVSPPQKLFRNDEESIIEATKHAKWAISALNFEDAATAVKELRIALEALGAS